MEQVVVVGVDSIAGHAIAREIHQSSSVRTFKISELSSAVPAAVADADLLIFCGGAASSSWDPGFGDLTAEEDWLDLCLAKCSPDCRVVFISSDAVFDGPWVFHDDDSAAVSTDGTAARIQNFEARVAARADSLIVRTNVLGLCATEHAFTRRVVDRLETGQCEHLPGRSYATPIAASDFAALLVKLLDHRAVGFINVAGAERTSPWRLGTTLASALGHSSDALLPEESAPVVEHSLRCQRLRQEFGLSGPVLRQTVDCLVDELQSAQQSNELLPAAA